MLKSYTIKESKQEFMQVNVKKKRLGALLEQSRVVALRFENTVYKPREAA